jgi:hypothetical protein
MTKCPKPEQAVILLYPLAAAASTPNSPPPSRSFRVSERMGSPETLPSRTKLALTLKVKGGMWLKALTRKPVIA